MRRHDREVTDPEAILALIEAADACRIGIVDVSGPVAVPYIVAMNHAYEPRGDRGLSGTFWFHSAREGRKLELLRSNPQVCIQLDGEHEPVKNALGCGWGMKFASVFATGCARIVDTRAERLHGLECLMAHYLRLWGPLDGQATAEALPPINEKALSITAVFRVDVETMTAKRKP